MMLMSVSGTILPLTFREMLFAPAELRLIEEFVVELPDMFIPAMSLEPDMLTLTLEVEDRTGGASAARSLIPLVPLRLTRTLPLIPPAPLSPPPDRMLIPESRLRKNPKGSRTCPARCVIPPTKLPSPELVPVRELRMQEPDPKSWSAKIAAANERIL